MSRRRIFTAIVSVIGAVSLAVLLDRFGVAGIGQMIGGVGGWFVVIAAIDLASVACDAIGVHGFLRSQVAELRFWPVFAAQASGLAINRLTPASSLGEPLKVTMLMSHVPQEAAVSSIVMFNVATIYVGIAAIVLGVPLTLLALDLPPRAELAVALAAAGLVIAALALALAIRRGAIATAIDGLAAVRIVSPARASRWRAQIAGIDAQVRTITRARQGIAGVVGSRLLNWAGSLVLIHAAGIPLTAPLVIATCSVGILITWLSNVIPLGLGIADTGNYVLYGLLGAAPASGLDFTMVNRARTCVLAAMGLTVMLVAHLVRRRG